MSEHSVADAETNLSELIDRALAGEDMVILRKGHGAVALRPIGRVGRAVTATDLDWLARRRIGMPKALLDAGHHLGTMRDADER